VSSRRGARPRPPAGLGAPAAARVLTVARQFVLLQCVALVGVLAWSVPALALSQRGHVPGFSFGSEGEGASQFQFEGAFKLREGAGIAVNETTGDVYVVDRGNYRVQEFGPTGNFLAAWGWGVKDGKEEFEVCTSACHAGVPAVGKGGLKEAGAIAVDNSPGGAGMVYVGANASAQRPDVQRFPANGETALGRLAVAEEGRLDGVAVDRHGTVWLYRGEEEELGVIEGFSGAAPPVRLEPSLASPLACPKPGLAVDAGGENFYVDHELLSGEGECPAVEEMVKAEEGEPAEGKDARPVVTGKLNAAQVLATGETAISELDRQNTTGVAVDQASAEGSPFGEAGKGDVYVDNGSSVAAYSASGAIIQHFGAGDITQGMGVAVNAKTGDVYVVDGGADKVEVFEPEPAGEPAVEGLSALNLTPSEVQLSAQVDPQGADTHYYFQFGTVDCVVNPSACSDVPAAPGIDLGSGFGAQSVSATLQGLRPSITYYYRVVASNAFGLAEGSQSLGSIDTLPSSLGVLADGRAWELVSPPEKDGSSIEPLAKEGGLIQASADGSAVTYVATGPVVPEPQGNRAPESTQVLSTRSAAGWSSEDIVTPHRKGEGIEGGEPSEYKLFSEDLSLSLVQPPGGSGGEPLEAPPLAPGASEKTLYVRDSPSVAPAAAEQKLYGGAEANRGFLSPGFLPLLTPMNVTAETKPGEKTKFGGKLNFLATTADLSDVVFESEVPLLAGSAPGLYEWEAGGLIQLVSVLPGGAPAESPELGGEGMNVRNAVSEDGSRVFFTAEGAEGDATGLYMRDTRKNETIQINAAQGVVEPTGEESEVGFQAATKDGSKVFFSDTAPLTAQSTQRQQREADLYECEVVEKNGKLTCDLTDLTPLPSGGSADVLNVIPGISEDGAEVYFVANGVLAPGAKPGHCVHESEETAPAGATCNLYVAHDGAVTFIAALSNKDSGDWGSLHGVGRVGGFAVNRPDLADVTSRVSPDGEYLAFMSNMPLTGYENLDANHKAEGVREEEVYLYDAATGLLVCASCNPNGPSTGVLDTPLSGEGVGLVVDRREDWTGQYLAGSVPGWTPLGVEGAIHQPRYLSNSGRLFFNSPDELVPQATNGKEDVYEYEPVGVGSCGEEEGCVSLISSGTAKQESAFLDASENGEDAFFLTAQPLVAADHDTNYDVYDARVCTSSSPCLSSEASSVRPCETSKTCRPEPSPQPTFGAPTTATSSGPGNSPKQEILDVKTTKPTPTLTRAQLLAKALKACRKQKKKRKRVACEKQARKRYPAKSKGKKSSATKKASK
jgi:hypothetical protein